jgi:hypothetical protein
MRDKTIDFLSPYYKEAFKNHQLGSTFIKWNWGPFFFSYFWLFYKRMYLSGFIVILILILSLSFPFFINFFLVGLLVRFILSLYGTSLYGKKLAKNWDGINPPQNNIGIIITIIAAFFVIIVSAFSICFLWEDLDCCGGYVEPISRVEVQSMQKMAAGYAPGIPHLKSRENSMYKVLPSQ